MTDEKRYFLSNVKIIFSPQEKQGKNDHILQALTAFGVKYEKLYAPNDLKQGDYTFVIDGKDYRDEFLIERKFGLEELDKCLTDRNIDTKAKQKLASVHQSVGADKLRDNLEAEFVRMLALGVKEKWLFIENCPSFESIRHYTNGYERRSQTAGQRIYATISSWSCANRYDFRVACLPNKADFAPVMLSKMFYFWRNSQKRQLGQNFLRKLKTK